MLIRYNGQNIFYVELVTHHINQLDSEGKSIPLNSEMNELKLNRKHIILVPGVHEVTEDEWKVIQYHNQDLITAGLLEELKLKTQSYPGKPSKEAVSLAEVNIKQARELVKECTDINTLQKWATDPRADIRGLADKQIKEIFKKEGKSESDMPEPIYEEDVVEAGA